MRYKSFFERSHELISRQLNYFADKLQDLVLNDGTINNKNLIGIFNEQLEEFSSELKLSTNFLVVKLSKKSEDTYTITPKEDKDFNNKVRFIEEVFQKLKNTEIFFDHGERIITFCHSSTEMIQKVKKYYGSKLIAFKLRQENDPILDITKNLLLFSKTNTTSTVETEFCREVSKNNELIEQIKWICCNPMLKYSSNIHNIGKDRYGFRDDITKLLLLVKWMVFPNVLVLFYPTPSSSEFGQGGIVWGIDLSKNLNSHLFWCIESYAAILCSFIDKILYAQQQQKAKTETLKAIIAEIINRNYAHHIGSHISLRATFDKILLRLGKKIEDSLSNKEIATIAQMITKLDQYKDERNEFIAGLNNEPIFQPFYFYQDVILPLVENTLFMDNIAKNEGICYVNKNGDTNNDIIDGKNSKCRLKIKVFLQQLRNGSEEAIIAQYSKDNDGFDSLNLPYFNEVNQFEDTFYDTRTIDKDFLVSLPGSLGKHCIYSILENFIRNTAKHSYNKASHKNIEIEIILKIRETEEHYDVELTDNISDGDKHTELREKINTSILDRKNLGISDMKINACLLAGEKLTDDNMKKSLVVGKNDENHIAYNFKLLKHKEIALIGGEWKTELKNKNKGIYYYNDLNEYLNECKIKNFRFTIVDSSVKLDDLIKNHNQLPYRVLIIKANSKSKNQFSHRRNFHLVDKSYIENCNNTNELISKCWDAWLHSFGQSSIDLITYFEQTITEEPTKDWNNFITTNQNKYCSIIKPQIWYNNNKKNLVQSNIKLDNRDTFYILYDRHAKMAGNLCVSILDKHFYEQIDKNNLDFNTIFNTKEDKLNEIFINELVEAGLTNVLVIDERAAEASTELITDSGGDYCQINKRGFGKFSSGFNGRSILKFDACWAAKIFIATHICYNDSSKYIPLNKEIDEKNYNTLKIKFRKGNGKIVIAAETNFMEWDEQVKYNGRWKKNGAEIKEAKKQPIRDFKVDLLIIHRTILKNILENTHWESIDFINGLDVSRILIVTGGGVVDFITEKEKPKIISTDILRNYIIGSRPAKLNLVKFITS